MVADISEKSATALKKLEMLFTLGDIVWNLSPLMNVLAQIFLLAWKLSLVQKFAFASGQEPLLGDFNERIFFQVMLFNKYEVVLLFN